MSRVMIAVTQRLNIRPSIFLAVYMMCISDETAQLFSQLTLALFLYRVICVGHNLVLMHVFAPTRSLSAGIQSTKLVYFYIRTHITVLTEQSKSGETKLYIHE